MIPIGKSSASHKRLIKYLRYLGIVLVEQHRASFWDRTNYYTIDYDRFDQVIGTDQDESSVSMCEFKELREDVDNSIDTVDKTLLIDEEAVCLITDNTSLNKTYTTIETTLSTNRTLHLLPCAEQYRNIIQKSTESLSDEVAQILADEISGTIQAISEGKRKPVHGFFKWIPSLVKAARSGNLVIQFATEVAQRRQSQYKALELQKAKSEKLIKSAAKAQADFEKATKKISEMSADELAKIAEIVCKKIPFSEFRERVEKEIMDGRIPFNLGRSETIAEINCKVFVDGG